MRAIGTLGVAALVASAMILAMAFVLVPETSWTNTSIISLVFFALSVGFVFYVPSVLVQQRAANDAVQMAALGPLGVLTSATLLLTSGGFLLAMTGFDKTALAVDIFAIGTFVISALVLRAALSVVGDVAATYSAPSSHLRWQDELQALASIASDRSIKGSLEKLAEKFRYLASDLPGGSPYDGSLDEAVQLVGKLVMDNSSADLPDQIRKTEILMAQRDVFLKAARSKA